jgi:hypothetical protein
MTNTNLSLSIGEVVRNAWDKVNGSKKTIWLAFIIFCATTYGIGTLGTNISTTLPFLKTPLALLCSLINVLLQAGFLYIGIQRALDHPISYPMIFRALQPSFAIRILGLYLLKIIIILPISFLIGFTINMTSVAFANDDLFMKVVTLSASILSILLLLYVTLRLFAGMGFVIDKKVNPWQAVKLSFQTTRSNVLNLAALTCIELIILAASIIPLGIGLIWSVPLALIIYGMIYRKLSLNLPHRPYPKEAALFYYLNKKFNPGIS